IILKLSGKWNVSYWQEMQTLINQVPLKIHSLILDLKRVDQLDSFGAWILTQFDQMLKHKNITTEVINCSQDNLNLLKTIQKTELPKAAVGVRHITVPFLLEQLGEKSVDLYVRGERTTIFLGHVVVRLFQTLVRPKLFRYKSFVKFVAEAGIYALPIVGLISF